MQQSSRGYCAAGGHTNVKKSKYGRCPGNNSVGSRAVMEICRIQRGGVVRGAAQRTLPAPHLEIGHVLRDALLTARKQPPRHGICAAAQPQEQQRQQRMPHHVGRPHSGGNRSGEAREIPCGRGRAGGGAAGGAQEAGSGRCSSAVHAMAALPTLQCSTHRKEAPLPARVAALPSCRGRSLPRCASTAPLPVDTSMLSAVHPADKAAPRYSAILLCWGKVQACVHKRWAGYARVVQCRSRWLAGGARRSDVCQPVSNPSCPCFERDAISASSKQAGQCRSSCD